MNFKERVKEAAALERRESILLMRVLVCGLWFFLGVVVGQGICVLFGVQNESIGVIIRLATVILGAWGIMHFWARAMLRNSSKIIEKRICSHFPEGTTVDEVYAMVDRMEEVIIPGNSGMIRCNSEGIAYVVRTQRDGSNYGVMPADKIKNMRLKNNLIMIDGNAAFANSAQEAWKAFYEIANRTGRTDQLAPRKVICAALNIVRMRLLQEMIKYTGIKMEKSVDIFFSEVKKEEKRRNDEEFSHTVKNFRRLHDAIMPFIYNYDGEDSDWRYESMREHQEAEVLHQLYAFLEALPGAGEIDLICAFCGAKMSGDRDKKIDKFDFYPKALWEQMDLGFGEIIRPFLENEWRYVK